ncbi:uncharacterized protein MEPE_00773 [Melanopsichium pennsylvanicum]|uniref:Uncharacterized protein n=1 Tax=Melanopsichium pennsylvanicum TaxID=63383 RepID=A0AAJ5C300_9BASI|nr:uncharacterized protein MEPE_00773 [Melanopsichium pennsylvanicum]
MATTRTSSAPTLDTLTLDHILADLEALPSNHSLFSLAQRKPTENTGSSSQRIRTQKSVLSSFEIGTDPMGRKEYVALSHELLASYRNAQRLNSEQVTPAQVGLVLPSERNRTSRSSSASISTAMDAVDRNDSSAGMRWTRTDLLHAKVADLQTMVEDWDRALEGAVEIVNGSQSDDSTMRSAKGSVEDQGTTFEAADETRPVSGQTHTIDFSLPIELDMASSTRTSQPSTKTPTQAHTSLPLVQDTAEGVEQNATKFDPIQHSTSVDPNEPEQLLEDDDPWNDLT